MIANLCGKQKNLELDVSNIKIRLGIDTVTPTFYSFFGSLLFFCYSTGLTGFNSHH
jgi:hypothetical protein